MFQGEISHREDDARAETEGETLELDPPDQLVRASAGPTFSLFCSNQDAPTKVTPQPDSQATKRYWLRRSAAVPEQAFTACQNPARSSLPLCVSIMMSILFVKL